MHLFGKMLALKRSQYDNMSWLWGCELLVGFFCPETPNNKNDKMLTLGSAGITWLGGYSALDSDHVCGRLMLSTVGQSQSGAAAAQTSHSAPALDTEMSQG